MDICNVVNDKVWEVIININVIIGVIWEEK